MRIILQRYRASKAAQHHSLPPAVIKSYLHKEAAALIGAVVQLDAASPSTPW
jgi:hypothetical protein